MSREVTITVSDEVYHGLQAVAGDRTMSELIEELARPVVATASLEASYREMSSDVDREREADEWTESLIQDSFPGGHVSR
jgi:predicted CopG family antitoxin